MNVATILNKTRFRVKDFTITVASICEWINSCQDAAALELGLPTYFVESLSSDEVEYAWPDTLLNVSKVELLDSDEAYKSTLVPINFSDIEAATGTATNYFINGRNVGVYPYPETTTTDKIRVHGIQKFLDVSSETDTPSLPVVYHNLFLPYCAGQYYEFAKDLSSAQYYMTRFEARLSSITEKDEIPSNDVYTVLRGGWPS